METNIKIDAVVLVSEEMQFSDVETVEEVVAGGICSSGNNP